MGSNVDFMKIYSKPKEFAYPSDLSWINYWHETIIIPTKVSENKTPGCFFHPASIGDAPGPLKTNKKQYSDKILGPQGQGV